MKKEEDMARLLGKDELILWSGKPQPFDILKNSRFELFRNYLIILVIFVPAIVAAAIARTSDPNVNINLIIGAFVVTVVAISFSLLGYHSYRKNCTYYLSNKNIIVSVSESKYLKYSFNQVDKIEEVRQGAGTKSIRIGKIVGKPLRNNLEYAVNCIFMDQNGDNKGYCMLFNLSDKDAAEVLALINQQKGKYNAA
ncbi:MAG: hypothetical protein RBT41_03320 [Clostridia bacterium]|jgi:hypothetical protein|nr:hypothetical protein [Clostridia bacterium]